MEKSIFHRLWKGPSRERRWRKLEMEAIITRDGRTIKAKGYLQIAEALKPGVVEFLDFSKCKLSHNIVLALSSHLHDKDIKVKELNISNNKDMEPAAYEKVVEILQTAKVDILRMLNCDLGKIKLQVFQRSLKDKKIKMQVLGLSGNKTIEPEGFQHIAEIFPKADIRVLGLHNCQLTSEKLSTFKRHLHGKAVKIDQLELVDNKDMEPAAYKEVAGIVNVAVIGKLFLNACDLNEEKLSSFQKNLRENTKMEALVLNENKTIEPEGFQHIAEIFQKADIQILLLWDCQLTSEKLSAFKQHLHGKDIKIEQLELVCNKDMEPAAYKEVAEIVDTAVIGKLFLSGCNLNEEKLSSFLKSLRENTKMQALVLNENKTIEPEGFQHIAEIFQKADIQILLLWDCQLTSEKLNAFKQHLHGKDIKIAQLSLSDNKSMESAAYKEVAEIVNTAGIDRLCLDRCDLNKEKLSSFQKSLGENTKMEWLILDENKTIEPEGFQHIADIFQNADIQGLTLCDCHLTSDKLSAFNQYLHGKAVEIPSLHLNKNKDMGPASYRELAIIMETAKVDQLWLEHCDLDDEKLYAFHSGLTGLQIKVKQLNISNNRGMEPSAYSHIADIVDEAKVDVLALHNCDLNGKKLEEFLKNFRLRNIKMALLSLEENRTIECKDFEHIVGILEVASITRLSLSDCDLTLEKLQAFSLYLTGRNAKVKQLNISNNRGMEPSAYHQIADIVDEAKVDVLALHNCDLNGKKLEEFLKNFRLRNIKMALLSLEENRTIECKDFEHIVSILEVASITKLSLGDCDLTLEKLQAFSLYLTGRNAKVSILDITKNRRIDPSCKEMQEIINKAKIITLLSDKDEKQNQPTMSRLKKAKGTDGGFQQSVSSRLGVLSSSALRISEDRDTDSGIGRSFRGSEDTMSVRTDEKVKNWLEGHPGTAVEYPKEETIVAKALELGAKSHQPHSTELKNLLTSLKEEELSSEGLINIFKEQNDGSDPNGTFILAECVAEMLGAELETQQSLSAQTFDFIDKALHNIDDARRIQLTINCTNAICKIYFALSEYHEAVDFCRNGIQLLKGTGNADNLCLGDLQQNLGFAYASLHELSAARSYYLQALESYKASARDGAQKKVQLLERRLKDVDRSICAQLPVLQSHGIQARVGSSGAVMTSEDCVINFPEGAIPSDTNIYLYLDDNAAHLPIGVIPITPVIRITPCMTLEKNASVKLRTWCNSKSGGNAIIYFKKMEESEWKSIDEVALGKQQYFEFKISEFCNYCVATDGNQMDGKELAVESCLFYNAGGILTNHIIPDCATMKKRLLEEMKSRECISACMANMKFMVNINDSIKVKLTAQAPEDLSFDDEQTVIITEKLLRGFGNHQNFLLPRDREGKIDFNHHLQHLPKDEEPGESYTHVDRITIGSGFQRPISQVITVSGTYATGHSQVTSHATDTVMGAFGGKS